MDRQPERPKLQSCPYAVTPAELVAVARKGYTIEPPDPSHLARPEDFLRKGRLRKPEPVAAEVDPDIPTS